MSNTTEVGTYSETRKGTRWYGWICPNGCGRRSGTSYLQPYAAVDGHARLHRCGEVGADEQRASGRWATSDRVIEVLLQHQIG